MEIVIKIDEDYYEIIKHDVDRGMDYLPCVLIAKGTPLPAHHGRLIDEQQIIDRFKPIERFKHWCVGTDGLFNVLSDAPSIIEGSESK